MGMKSLFKKAFTGGLSVKRWLSYDSLKRDTQAVTGLASNLFNGKQAGARKETFEEAMQRFGLTESDIEQKIKKSRQLVFIFLCISLLIFLYALYIFSHMRILDGIICLTLMSLVVAYAFREHFNLFQMRQRRLGCTYREWLQSLLKRSK